MEVLKALVVIFAQAQRDIFAEWSARTVYIQTADNISSHQDHPIRDQMYGLRHYAVQADISYVQHPLTNTGQLTPRGAQLAVKVSLRYKVGCCMLYQCALALQELLRPPPPILLTESIKQRTCLAAQKMQEVQMPLGILCKVQLSIQVYLLNSAHPTYSPSCGVDSLDWSAPRALMPRST